MTQNNPTYYVNAATQAVREGQVPDADFDSGMNAGGSNACGIGIGPAVNIVGTTNQFTLLDQTPAARTPQLSQPIGGTALGAGSSTAPDAADPIRFGTNAASGNGTPTATGVATLVSLAAGWTAV
jgi:hypothetical protein|tara:strand:- start:398 stop:772 length:375 start_codon:yes stop_codon:yes gene_type:complete